jgi:hypothetical protein
MFTNNRLRSYIFLAGFSLLLVACQPALAEQELSFEESPVSTPEATLPLIPTAIPTQELTEEPLESIDPFAGINIRFNPSYWPDTDFTKHIVDYEEFLSGGPPPDGIPAIDSPVFERIDDADKWLQDDWPVMLFEWNGDVRAYPLTILIYHEIVNDIVGDRDVAITFCPLCNATIAFDRALSDGTVLDFGTSGNLRNSDLVMYDRQTSSWWQQFTGEAIVGELTGTQLEFLPSQIISWRDFKENHPDGDVLSRDTGYLRNYGRNPYSGYDTLDGRPFLFDGNLDGRLPPIERVVAIEINGIDKAYPFHQLEELLVINDEVEGHPMVIFWKEGTSSTFGNTDLETGSTGVFFSTLNGEILTFLAVDGGFQDENTGSHWNILGEAIEGSLAGQKLERVVSAEHFWFAWAAFRPDTIIWTPAG